MKNRILSSLLIVTLLLSLLPVCVFASSDDRAQRSVYLHAQGEAPDGKNRSTVYMGDTADLYFAVDDPNKGVYEDGAHKEPQFDLNGYTVRICFDPAYFDLASPDATAPIDYTVPDASLAASAKGEVNTSSEVVTDVPQEAGYYVFNSGSGTYETNGKTYQTAYITVFFGGSYVPQKKDGQTWYNLAKLPLTPKKAGSTEVFIDVDSGDASYTLELFAKNHSENLNEQTFQYDVVNGGYHTIVIKETQKPAPPMADPPAGDYIEQQTVTLTQKDGCKIYYTTDGTDPQTDGTEYTAPLDITATTEIRACAYRESDGKYSNTVAFHYTIRPDRPYLFDGKKALISDIYSENSQFSVYASDKNIFADIPDGSEVYYTFGDADAENPTIGTDPEAEWVKLDKTNPSVEINKKRIMRLMTTRAGEWSDPAIYYLSVKPAAVTANVPSGEYHNKIEVTLSTSTAGAKIYYTTDGTNPKSSPTAQEYTDARITLAANCTLRAAALYDEQWSDNASWYYLFKTDDYGISAFYPSGTYEGSINVTLMQNDPAFKILYHTGDGVWKDYNETLTIDRDQVITAMAVDSEGNTGDEYVFTYKIKPLPPEFAPESTQFTNADTITVRTPESTQENTGRYELYYTLDGTDPITSETRIKADEQSDAVTIDITKYTVVTAAVLKDGESWSTVEQHAYDIVTKKPMEPITTLLPGHYTREIGGAGFSTQFMPVPHDTELYYTVCYDGALCPDPVPNTDGTIQYDGVSEIEIKGTTVIKAVAVNAFGVESDVGIFSYVVAPEAPGSAPSATFHAPKLPVVPVDAVVGSTVKYTVGSFQNEFVNTDAERFYIDTHTGNAYRDEACTAPLGHTSETTNADTAVLELFAELDGVESDHNRYVYSLSDDTAVLAPPYADKVTGTYEERKVDDDNNLLAISLYSLNDGGEIQYRLDNSGEWMTYADGAALLLKEDTVVQLRCAENGAYSDVVSYVYHFVPLAPVIELPSGTYFESDNKTTGISLDADAPTNKNYSVWYRQNGDVQDSRYTGQESAITQTTTLKAYVKNEDTGRVSRSAISYYIIEKASAAGGSVYIADPYDTERISAASLGTGAYAEGIKLLTQNKNADIHYYYSYTKKADGQTVTTNAEVYDITRPIIPTALMEDITIHAWLEDENGRIAGSDGSFVIDFIHLNVPVTSLGSETVEFAEDTKYTLINEYSTDDTILLYYTLDGSDPADSANTARKLYNGEELTLSDDVTVKAVYFSACGTCVECNNDDPAACWYGVYGKTGTYQYAVINDIIVDNTRKYTSDIFGNEHPTHTGYINGYPDGSVQPEGGITREEMTAILYRIMSHDYESPFVETGKVFPDVALGRWSVHNIEYMADKNVVFGYPDGEFKPTRRLTRAEFAALIYRFVGENLTKGETENPFGDLSDKHWAYQEILTLYKNGLIEGYEDGSFRSEDDITRAEVMTVINQILGRKPLDGYVKSLNFNPYNDLKSDKWYYTIVLEATITHEYYLEADNGYEYQWENWQ